jgi:PrcB C-terminal
VAFLVPGTESRPVQWQDVRAGPLTFSFAERRLFRDRAQFRGFLRSVGARRSPSVDFATRQLLFLSPGPRSSTGYGIDVLGVSKQGDEITVKVRERAPGLEDHVTPRVTYPYRLISLPAGSDVFVDWVGR